MKTKEWSRSWKASKKPRKQRKYVAKAPIHLKGKFMTAHLSKELAKKYARRGVRLRKGDTVKLMRGKFRKKTGTVEEVDLKNSRIYVTGIEFVKKDGSKAKLALHPSNVLIVELALSDRKRVALLSKKIAGKESGKTLPAKGNTKK